MQKKTSGKCSGNLMGSKKELKKGAGWFFEKDDRAGKGVGQKGRGEGDLGPNYKGERGMLQGEDQGG